VRVRRRWCVTCVSVAVRASLLYNVLSLSVFLSLPFSLSLSLTHHLFNRISPFTPLSGVGKSTLAYALEGKAAPADVHNTRGIAVRPIVLAGHPSTDFSLWDSAGQEQV
jgi:hypothetical protein